MPGVGLSGAYRVLLLLLSRSNRSPGRTRPSPSRMLSESWGAHVGAGGWGHAHRTGKHYMWPPYVCV
eukprot:3045461-Prymnesium_polylepis.1